MNSKTLTTILASALVLMGAASCSTLGSKSKKATTETVKPQTEAPSKQKPAVNTQLPVENLNGTPVEQAAASVAPNSALVNSLNGEWIITEAASYKISRDEDMPYVNFTEADGKFYANNGCNVLNGNFLFKGVNQVTFSNVISTMMYCPDVKFDHAISSVLQDGSVVTVTIETKGQETYMQFRNSANKVLMTMRKHNLESLNGLWKFQTIEGEKVEGKGLNIFFDIPELSVHGNTGCNYFNGTIVIDPQKPNSISFSQMGVTMRMCENADLERTMLVALEETASYGLDGNKLILYDLSGKKLATLNK